jgi:hypothetical protein
VSASSDCLCRENRPLAGRRERLCAQAVGGEPMRNVCINHPPFQGPAWQPSIWLKMAVIMNEVMDGMPRIKVNAYTNKQVQMQMQV